MKTTTLIFSLLLGATISQAQVKGNAKERSIFLNPSSSGNINYYANSIHTQGYVNKSDANYEANAGYPQGNSYTFEVSGMYNATADDYVAIFNINQVGKTAKSVDSIVVRRIEDFKKELSIMQVQPERILTDMISLVPVFEIEVEKKLFSKSYNEVPKGFELIKNVHIHFKDPEDLDKIITAAAKNEIYDLVKVDYFVKDTETIYDQLREKAIAEIKKKREAFKALGVDLDTIYHTFTEAKNVAFPADRYKSYQAYSSSSIDAVYKKTGINKVKKPTSYYYSKLPSHRYDFIINPTIVEPAVQYTYNIKITYLIKEDQPKEVKKFYIITEDGNLKLVNLQ